jgi:hypothetical protein
MADDTASERDERMKATNEYPELPADRREIHAGSGGRHAPPAYGAPPGRNIDRNADPAAPETHPADISRRPGAPPRTLDESVGVPGSARGPGEQAPPGTVADRAGGGQALRPDDLDRDRNPARVDRASAAAEGASTGHGQGGPNERDVPPAT